MQDNQSAIIQIAELSTNQWGAKITAHDKRIYNINQKKKSDGKLSTAWKQMGNMGIKTGDTVEVWYAEVPNQHGGTSRYINSFREAGGRPITQSETPHHGANNTSQDTSRDDKFWERQAYEKCCSLWAAALLQKTGELELTRQAIQSGKFWEMFQAIKAEGAKKFFDFSKLNGESEPLPTIDVSEDPNTPWPKEAPPEDVSVEDIPF